MDLQGHPGDGKSCGLSSVQVDLKCIGQELTTAYEHYKLAPPQTIEGQWHFSTQIKLALDKAQEYYAKLDNSAAYLAVVVLHPNYGWKFIESQWQYKKSWIVHGKAAVKDLWLYAYKQQPVAEAISPQKEPVHEPNMMKAYRLKGLTIAKTKARKVAM
jgi:hypothetical protein